MGVKAGYKQSEVGVIPEDWNWSPLKSLCEKIQDGTHFSPTIKGNDYFYITSKNIGFGKLKLENVSRIDELQHRAIYKRCDVKNGDLLLTKDGANTGNAAMNELSEEFSLLSSVAFLRFNEKIYSADYFLQQILSDFGQKQIKEAMSGNAITRLTLAKINALKFPVPNLPEQKAIANALSDVDQLIASLDQLIAKKRDLKQAAMQQLLTGKTRLQGFSGDWETKRLGDVTEIRSGGTPSTSRGEFWNGDVPWCTPTDITALDGRKFLITTARMITTAGLAKSSAEMIDVMSVIMTSRATIGECAINLVPVSTNQGFKNFIPTTDIKLDFLYYFLKSQRLQFIQLCSGSTFLEINKRQLENYPIRLPPRSEQQAISAILSDMDTELAELEQRRDKTVALKQGMMQELLTGRTRLV